MKNTRKITEIDTRWNYIRNTHEFLLCFRLLESFELSFFPSFTCFQMVVLFTSSVILIGFDGMINESFAFEISRSPGYGGG